mmetsp:Transcript_40319/g.121443  ORF Transcript_40319/g.121443 Transcript_40319/m.121443 type:complete len:270 (+) Transcript_40319:661-1470(+)
MQLQDGGGTPTRGGESGGRDRMGFGGSEFRGAVGRGEESDGFVRDDPRQGRERRRMEGSDDVPVRGGGGHGRFLSRRKDVPDEEQHGEGDYGAVEGRPRDGRDDRGDIVGRTVQLRCDQPSSRYEGGPSGELQLRPHRTGLLRRRPRGGLRHPPIARSGRVRGGNLQQDPRREALGSSVLSLGRSHGIRTVRSGPKDDRTAVRLQTGIVEVQIGAHGGCTDKGEGRTGARGISDEGEDRQQDAPRPPRPRRAVGERFVEVQSPGAVVRQ